MFEPRSLWAVSAYVWTVLVIIHLQAIHRQSGHKRKIPRAILLAQTLNTVVRTVWFFFHYDDIYKTVAMIFINRLAILFQFTGLSILFVQWGEMATKFSKDSMIKFAAGLNILLYIPTIVCAVADTTRYTNVTLASLILVAVASLVLAVSGLGFGIALYGKLKDGPAHGLAFAKVLIRVTTLVASCFIVRTFCFLWHPAYGTEELPHELATVVLYPYFFYHVPEALPNLVIMLTTTPMNGSAVKYLSRKYGKRNTEDTEHMISIPVRQGTASMILDMVSPTTRSTKQLQGPAPVNM